MVSGLLGQKSSQDLISTEKRWAWWHTYFLAMTGNVKLEDRCPGWPGQKVRPYRQNN
jgi:hypothetical protein